MDNYNNGDSYATNCRHYPNNFVPAGTTRREALYNDDLEIKDIYMSIGSTETLLEQLKTRINELHKSS